MWQQKKNTTWSRSQLMWVFSFCIDVFCLWSVGMLIIKHAYTIHMWILIFILFLDMTIYPHVCMCMYIHPPPQHVILSLLKEYNFFWFFFFFISMLVHDLIFSDRCWVYHQLTVERSVFILQAMIEAIKHAIISLQISKVSENPQAHKFVSNIRSNSALQTSLGM